MWWGDSSETCGFVCWCHSPVCRCPGWHDSSSAVSIQLSCFMFFFYDRIALTFIEQIYWYCFKDYIIKFSTLIFCLLDFFALRIVTTVHKWDVSLSFWEVDRLRNYVIAFIQISWKALKFLFPDMVWYLSVWKLVQLPLWSHLLHCLL